MINQILTPELRNRIDNLDWQDNSYSDEKAFICCELSALAYYSIPEFELKNKRRIKIIPCEKYQEFRRSGNIPDFTNLAISNESDQIFTIYRRYAIVVGIKFRNVIFISIRGTAELYDWFINLNARKCRIGARGEKYHLGFFRAIVACIEPINEELKKYGESRDFPIYVTGHSLGGAMAGIFYKKWNRYSLIEDYPDPFWEINRYGATCSYTFGMPRYGNMAAVINRSPFHLYNKMDIVPGLPPKLMGFENSINERGLAGNTIENRTRFEAIKHLIWSTLLFLRCPIKPHFMETYRKEVAKLVQ